MNTEPMPQTTAPRMIYRLVSLGLGLDSRDGIIPREVLEGIDASGLIIERAEQEAELLRVAAREIYNGEKARGLSEGQLEAQQQAAARLLSEHAMLDEMLGALEGELADLVLDVMGKLIQDYDRSELATECVRSALATMRSEKRVQLHLPPALQESVRAGMKDMLADYPEIELIDIISDTALSPPDLRLESSLGVVNFVLDDTVAGLRGLLKGIRTKGDGQ